MRAKPQHPQGRGQVRPGGAWCAPLRPLLLRRLQTACSGPLGALPPSSACPQLKCRSTRSKTGSGEHATPLMARALTNKRSQRRLITKQPAFWGSLGLTCSSCSSYGGSHDLLRRGVARGWGRWPPLGHKFLTLPGKLQGHPCLHHSTCLVIKGHGFGDLPRDWWRL